MSRSHYFGLNSKVKINPSRPEGDPYYDPSDDSLLVIEVNKDGKKSLRALTGRSDDVTPGTAIDFTIDTGLGHRHERWATYTIVGAILPGGEKVGHIPTRALPHYRMK